MSKNGGFTIRYYFQTLSGIVGSPGHFFVHLPDPVGFRRSVGFLLVSSLFFTVASFTCFRENHWILSSIFWVNAFFMPLIASGVAFMVMISTLGRRIPFERLFAGASLLVSWIPFSTWLTEPWKWVLIGLGMVKGGGLRWRQMALVVGVSIVILVLLFQAFLPAVAFVRRWAG